MPRKTTKPTNKSENLPTISATPKYLCKSVLYSLLDVDNQRLHMIVLGETFIETLNFVLTTSIDHILSNGDSMLNRFRINIFPIIVNNIKYVILKSVYMEHIIRAVDYPNLTELKLFNYNDKSDINILFYRIYQKDVHGYIFKLFENLKYLSITGLSSLLSLCDLSLTNCSCSTLLK